MGKVAPLRFPPASSRQLASCIRFWTIATKPPPSPPRLVLCGFWFRLRGKLESGGDGLPHCEAGCGLSLRFFWFEFLSKSGASLVPMPSTTKVEGVRFV